MKLMTRTFISLFELVPLIKQLSFIVLLLYIDISTIFTSHLFSNVKEEIFSLSECESRYIKGHALVH